MDALIWTSVGVVLGWFGNWWFARGSRAQHAELVSKLDSIQAALALEGKRIEEERGPSGKLTRVYFVPLSGNQPAPTGELRAVRHFERRLSGNQPAPTGELSREINPGPGPNGPQTENPDRREPV
jgi:hypothetical protein